MMDKNGANEEVEEEEVVVAPGQQKPGAGP